MVVVAAREDIAVDIRRGDGFASELPFAFKCRFCASGSTRLEWLLPLPQELLLPLDANGFLRGTLTASPAPQIVLEATGFLEAPPGRLAVSACRLREHVAERQTRCASDDMATSASSVACDRGIDSDI
jgi:hypothetical protein